MLFEEVKTVAVFPGVFPLEGAEKGAGIISLSLVRNPNKEMS